ncbi:hypothetical protein FRACA_170054 [Frankia canadensis]|uniref:Uncharacterized protein n=1 Tax=Frankia canadensis TaxID=1836972 RepID=A0A2I2KN49_9ACTN|nr:hypothetical protein FRACA_170054 [Frankia canadensis]SOU54384.1 hypothetical protein FRACA_170054 [Frankia canadensis]
MVGPGAQDLAERFEVVWWPLDPALILVRPSDAASTTMSSERGANPKSPAPSPRGGYQPRARHSAR